MSREQLSYLLRLVKGGMLERATAMIEQELAKPEQKPVCNKDPSLCGFVQCQLGKVCKHTAQLEQEPYCWVQSKLSQGMFYKEKPKRIHTIPLYTAPLKREWVGLTDSDIALVSINSGSTTENFVNGIEFKLKELNT